MVDAFACRRMPLTVMVVPLAAEVDSPSVRVFGRGPVGRTGCAQLVGGEFHPPPSAVVHGVDQDAGAHSEAGGLTGAKAAAGPAAPLTLDVLPVHNEESGQRVGVHAAAVVGDGDGLGPSVPADVDPHGDRLAGV